MWTKIPFMTLSEAVVPTFRDGKWCKPLLSGRYKNMLRKEFEHAGVPWEFYKQQNPNTHPFNRAPKHTKKERMKAGRVERILKALERQPEIVLEHRKKILKEKPLSGFDKLVKQSLVHLVKKQSK